MRVLSFGSAAERDLEEVCHFLAERWGPDQADHYVRDVYATCEALASGDLPGRPLDDVWSSYRRQYSRSHAVYYVEAPESITVARILHQRMDVSRHLDQS